MRKLLPILLVAAAFLTPLYPVYAQGPESPAVKRIAKPTTASNGATLKPQGIMEKIEKVQDRVADAREKLATRAAALKTKLQKFRDKAKASRVENVSSNLNAVNARRTSQMQQSLNRISQVLAKLKTWVAQQEAAGKDVTALKQAISQTEASWTAADSAVKDQANNDYTIEVNTEKTVKEDAKIARDSLGTDLKTVHDKLISVRQTLSGALSSWKGGK